MFENSQRSERQFLEKVVKSVDFELKINDLIDKRTEFFVFFHNCFQTGAENKFSLNYSEKIKPYLDELFTYRNKLKRKNKLITEEDIYIFHVPIDNIQIFNEYRDNEKIHLKSLPCIIYYRDGIEISRLTEKQMHDDSNIKDFISQAKKLDNINIIKTT
jgi:hypothetical protein